MWCALPLTPVTFEAVGQIKKKIDDLSIWDGYSNHYFFLNRPSAKYLDTSSFCSVLLCKSVYIIACDLKIPNVCCFHEIFRFGNLMNVLIMIFAKYIIVH